MRFSWWALLASTMLLLLGCGDGGVTPRPIPVADGKEAVPKEKVSRRKTKAAELPIGTPAPEIEAEDIDGVPFRLSDYRGKVVLLDFWGNW